MSGQRLGKTSGFAVPALPGLAMLVTAMFGAHMLIAQSSLPATAPTANSVSQLPSANPQVVAPSGTHGSLDVQWDGHVLQVNANDVSLSSMLRSIAARTGLRLLGDIPNDRIFGNYGPAPLVEVLSQLLDGVQANVLFVDRTATRPAQLTLTSRNGGVTPVMPPEEEQPEPRQVAGPPAGRSFGGGAGRSIAGGDRPAPPQDGGGASVGNPPDVSTADSSGASANPASPNGVKTPQEIFEQLQRLRAAAANNQ